MKKIDQLSIDGHTLNTFLMVLEESSVSKAADRLSISQSAVSHTLEKLRGIIDDPLFVRAGRGIIPTPKALALKEKVSSILENLNSLTHERKFNPAMELMEFTIAANDFPLQLIFPRLFNEVSAKGINLRLNFIPAGVPSIGNLRTSRCQFIITPAPPVDKNIFKSKLLESEMVCFYDATKRKPPRTIKQYQQSRYAEVKFNETESSMMVNSLIYKSMLTKPTITVPNFCLLADFIKGSDLITTQLDVMRLGVLSNLDHSPLPIKTKTLRLYLVWHRRDHDDPAHRWLRQRIQYTVDNLLNVKNKS